MKMLRTVVGAVALLLATTLAADDTVGVIKTLEGDVTIHRQAESIDAALGASVYAQDEIITAADSSLGLLMHDDSRIAMGANTSMKLDQFAYDAASNDGNADVSIKHGTLSVIAGKMVEKKPGALKVKTPAAILAVRGTEFSVKVEPQP